MVSREEQIENEEQRLRWFQRQADDVSRLILSTDLPWVDIAIEIEKLREQAERLFRGKGELFSRVYERRFERLWDQWRPGEPRG